MALVGEAQAHRGLRRQHGRVAGSAELVAHGGFLGACSSVALPQHPGGHRGRRRPQSALQGRVTHQALEERAWAR